MPIGTVLDYIENEQYESLSSKVIEMAKKALLDFISASFAGYQNKASESAFKVSSWLGGDGDCTVIGKKAGASPLAATFVNSTLASCIDIDDGHRKAVGHPACMVLPSVLAAGEMNSTCSGKELITAIVTGYEVAIRCGIVMNSNHETLFYGSGGWAHFGSAAGAAKVKKLSREVTMNALTIGEVYGPTAQCGKSIAAGSMTKESVGWGAVTGLMGVFLAETGFTGVKNILMDDHLYHENKKKVFDTLSDFYEIENIYFKEYPACKWAHSPITAARYIKETFKPYLEDIEEIIVETFNKAVTLNHISPETSVAAQYSIPFNVANALYYGNVEPYHISYANLNNKEVLNIAKKVRLKPVEDLERKFPEKRPARLIVRMTNGQEYQKEVDIVKGDAENPFTWDELVMKFKKCTEGYLAPIVQSEIINQINNFENLTDLRQFMKLLKG
jgi:2-methylcitrate dehydratase PrpD